MDLQDLKECRIENIESREVSIVTRWICIQTSKQITLSFMQDCIHIHWCIEVSGDRFLSILGSWGINLVSIWFMFISFGIMYISFGIMSISFGIMFISCLYHVYIMFISFISCFYHVYIMFLSCLYHVYIMFLSFISCLYHLYIIST